MRSPMRQGPGKTSTPFPCFRRFQFNVEIDAIVGFADIKARYSSRHHLMAIKLQARNERKPGSLMIAKQSALRIQKVCKRRLLPSPPQRISASKFLISAGFQETAKLSEECPEGQPHPIFFAMRVRRPERCRRSSPPAVDERDSEDRARRDRPATA